MLSNIICILSNEARAYLRNHAAIFWTFAYPLILFFVLISIFGGDNNDDYLQFLIVGLAALTVVSTALFGFSSVLVEMRSTGALKMLQIFPITRFEFLVAFTLSRVLILTVFCLMFIYILASGYGLQLPIGTRAVLSVAAMILLGSIAFMAVGLIIAGVITKPPTATAIINLINLPVIFLSDLFIPVSIMPATVQAIATISPVYVFVNDLRSIATGAGSLIDHCDTLTYLLGLSVICLFVAVSIFKWKVE